MIFLNPIKAVIGNLYLDIHCLFSFRIFSNQNIRANIIEVRQDKFLQIDMNIGYTHQLNLRTRLLHLSKPVKAHICFSLFRKKVHLIHRPTSKVYLLPLNPDEASLLATL